MKTVSAALSAAVVASVPALASAQFTVVLRSGDSFAGTTVPFDESFGSIGLNDAGDFIALMFDDSTSTDTLYRGTLGSSTGTVIARSGVAFQGIQNLETGYAALNDAGDVIFSFNGPAAGPGDYGAIIGFNNTILAQHGKPIGPDTYGGTYAERVALNDQGDYAYFYRDQDDIAVNVPRLAINDAPFNFPATIGGHAFDQIQQESHVALNNHGAFLVDPSLVDFDHRSLVLVDGPTVTLLAYDGDPFTLNSSETVSRVQPSFDLNDAGDIAYVLSLRDGDAFRQVLVKNDQILLSTDGPLGGVAFSDWGFDGGLDMNQAGDIAFVFSAWDELTDEEPSGVVLNGAIVIQTGDALDGKVVAGVGDESLALNDNGQLLFNVYFTDGTSALVLYTVPEPATLALLTAGAVLTLRRRR